MESLIWKNIFVNDIDKVIAENAVLDIRTLKVSADGCHGIAYYVTLKSEQGMNGEVAAMLIPDIADTDKYMAIDRHSTYWSRPFWGSSFRELPQNVQALVIEDSGIYRAFVPVCDSIAKTVIRGTEDGMAFVITTNKDGLCDIPEQLSFICMEGDSVAQVMHAAAKVSCELLGNGLKMREDRPCSEVFEYLGWCSWDAFQIRVDHKGLVEKAKEFKEKNLPVHYAIIDDMWADIPNFENIPANAPFGDMVRAMHASRMRTFEGAPDRFPQGMKSAVEAIKAQGIPSVGIWFPTTGYWKGLDPDEDTAKALGDSVAMSADERYTVVPEPQKAQKYFDHLCGTTKEWGADFVKIDNQGFYHNFKNTYTFGESAHAVQNAIDSSAKKYFDGALINCMGMPSECMFHRTDSSVCRCSDDFKPESREWFSKHILQCAYNGLFQGQYHVNDWDMWWTDDEQAKKNSVCRAISGGPIYVSDKLGRTRPEILKPLILKDGHIIRADYSAIPTEDSIMQNPTLGENIFKLRNRHRENGVLAAFNINAENKQCKGTVSPADCNLPEGEYAYFEFFSQSGGILRAGDRIELTLDTNDDFKFYTFVPLTDGVAVMGRCDLFMGIGTVKRDGNKIILAEDGRIAVISDIEIDFFTANGEKLDVQKNGIITFIDAPSNLYLKF